jgi:hypothetical protein
MGQVRAGHKKTSVIGTIIVVLLLIAAYLFFTLDNPNQGGETEPAAGHKKGTALETQEQTPGRTLKTPRKSDHSGTDNHLVVEKQIITTPVFTYNEGNTATESARLMKDRLQAMGMEDSLDMIVRSDESFKIGGKAVSIQEVLKKAAVGKRQIHETRITESGETEVEQVHNYGIYVVRPGDNIWNIHFNILKEYFAGRGVQVTEHSDEPRDDGYSSGVGKILKFSETMVIIYNVIEEKIVQDIDLIEPLSKLIIYNMDEILALLSDIDSDQLDKIRFDGSTLWIPAPET